MCLLLYVCACLYICTIVYAQGAAVKKYAYDGKLDKAGVAKFQSDFFAGKLKPFLKSEEATDDDFKGNVKVRSSRTPTLTSCI